MKTMNFEYTNTCTCQVYDPETDESIDSTDCYGDCWEQVVYDFTEITKHLFDKNETNFWRIGDIQLWNRSVSGFAKAKTPQELLNAMSVNSEWIMMGQVFDDRIEYSLSHHDAMGSNSSVTIISEEQREELGLY